MSEKEKVIRLLKDLPENVVSKLSLQEIIQTLCIMLERNDSNVFEPTIENFMEALTINQKLSNNKNTNFILDANIYYS